MDYSSAFSYESINKYKTAFKYSKPHGTAVPNRSQYLTVSNLDGDDVSTTSGSIGSHGIAAYIISFIGYLLIVLTAPLSLIFSVKSIRDQQKAIQFRLGRFWDVKGPGVILIIPIIDKINLVDLRVKAFHVPPLLVMLDDGGSISLGATVMYSIEDAVVATLSLQDVNHTMRTLAQSVMYQVVSKYSMERLRKSRSDPNAFIKKELQSEITQWGLRIHGVELSHITELSAPPTAVQDVQAQLGSVFGEMGGLQGIITTAADFYFTPQSNESEDPAPSSRKLELMTHFENQLKFALHNGMAQTIGKKFLFHLFLNDNIQSQNPKDSRVFLLNCRSVPVGIESFSVENTKQMVDHDCDVKVKISLDDMIRLLQGQVSKTSLYFQGRVEVDGDTSALELLADLKELISFQDFSI